MKEQIIQIPDTLEIKEVKDDKIILVKKKKKKITYGDILESFPDEYHRIFNMFASEKQSEKFLLLISL